MKDRIKCGDPFAEVRLNTVSVGSREDTYRAVEILDDNREFQTVAIHGSDYELVPNTLAREIGQDVMSRSEYEWEHERTLWNGKNISMLYRSDNLVEIPQVGDAIAYGLRIENSYNGSIKLRVVAMAWVLSCLNGVTHPEIFGHYTFRHDTRGENSFNIEDAVQCISSGVNTMMTMKDRIAEMSVKRFDLPDLALMSDSIQFPKSSWIDVLNVLLKQENRYSLDNYSQWDVFQAFTNVTTHKMKGISSLSYSDSIGQFFLNGRAS